MIWSDFLSVTLIGVLAVVSPGPDFIVVTRNSLLYSKRVGVATALGITLGTVWWIVASLLAISYVISQAVVLFSILKFVGAMYLIYIGIQSLRSTKGDTDCDDTNEDTKGLSAGEAFRIGFLTNLLNPKAALFFLSFFSVILDPGTSFLIKAMYGIEISTIALVWFSLVALLLSEKRIKRSFQKFKVWIDRATGVVLITLGIKLALSESK